MVGRRPSEALGDREVQFRFPLPKWLPDRTALSGLKQRVLHPGNATKARVVVAADREGVPFVVKDLLPMHPLARWTYARRVLRREERILRHLSGTPGVPEVIGRIDEDAIAIEFMDGEKVRRKWHAPLIEQATLDLEAKVRELHARGVVHLDLRQHHNVLISAAGHVSLIDFESAVICRGKGPIFRTLQRMDELAVLKFKAKFAPGLLSESQRRQARRAEILTQLWFFHRIGPLVRWLLRTRPGDEDESQTA